MTEGLENVGVDEDGDAEEETYNDSGSDCENNASGEDMDASDVEDEAEKDVDLTWTSKVGLLPFAEVALKS